MKAHTQKIKEFLGYVIERCPGWWKNIKVCLFHIIPHHAISAFSYWLARIEVTYVKDFLITAYMRYFNINLEDALIIDQSKYKTFNEFFTREINPTLRPIDSDTFISPCDGTITQAGKMQLGEIIQAKNQTYTVSDLLASNDYWSDIFSQGNFCTIYLSPRDCHRVYMPDDGELIEMFHVPGRLFSVAKYSAEILPKLFVKNERVISIFKNKNGYFALIMIGAINVGSISMQWCGTVTPRKRALKSWRYIEDQARSAMTILKKGEEMGRFNIGSTVVVLNNYQDFVEQKDITMDGKLIKFGQPLGL